MSIIERASGKRAKTGKVGEGTLVEDDLFLSPSGGADDKNHVWSEDDLLIASDSQGGDFLVDKPAVMDQPLDLPDPLSETAIEFAEAVDFAEIDEQPEQTIDETPDVSTDGSVMESPADVVMNSSSAADIDSDIVVIDGLSLEGVLSPKAQRTRLSEEYRLIKRPILMTAFSQKQESDLLQNLLMITSSVAGEGKTYNALNLAISIAMEMDRTVLLVDADLAKPGLSRLLKMDNSKGLTELLENRQADAADFIHRTDIPKLRVMPAGRHHDRSTELLSSDAMYSLVSELASRYHDRIVVFDAPPLLATSEANAISRYMGQIILIVESAVTSQFLVKDALSHLDDLDRVSLLLNKVSPDMFGRPGYGYGYEYGYGYGYEAGVNDS